MTYLVGYSRHKDDRSAIELACQLARSRPEPVRVVTVVPSGWATPVAARDTDREFLQWAAEEGSQSAASAAEHLSAHPEVDATASWVGARSVPQALLSAAADAEASAIVVGSGDEAPDGRIRLTSKTDRLVHSSEVPVAIAPRGYRADGPVTRVTVGFRDDDASWSLLTAVADLCRRANASLRLVTFLVAPGRMATTTVTHAETQVIELWALQAAAAQREAQEHLSSAGFDGDVEASLAEGADWEQAVGSLDWHDGDILVVGSSSTHRLAQVFLGSSASKIIRHSPVPVVAVPGAAVE
ncbi:MAG: universal stress protein [Microbacterium sp.]|uniref:universal stress protein n=1 Tax=Microbacterium sp. TaxID=51671 RepID=UPI0039E445CE